MSRIPSTLLVSVSLVTLAMMNHAGATTITGSVTDIVNPFAGASYATSGAGFAFSGGAASAFDGDMGSSHRITNISAGTGGLATLTATRGSATPIGTVVSYTNFGDNVSAPPSYTLKLDGATVQGVSGPPINWNGTRNIAVKSLGGTVSATALDWSVTGSETGRIFQQTETFFLADSLMRIAATGGSASAGSAFSGGAGDATVATDLTLGTLWLSANSGQVDRFLVLDLPGTQRLDTIIFIPGRLGQNVDLQRPDGVGGWITFASVDNPQEAHALKVDGSVPAMNQLRFFFDASDQTFASDSRISEVLLLVVPEPASMSLLAAAGLALWGRRSSRR